MDSRIALNLQAYLLAVAPGGPTLQIQVPTVLGHDYNVYRTPTLPPTAWDSITNFPGTGSPVLVNDPIGGNPQFYRVIATPLKPGVPTKRRGSVYPNPAVKF